jgi:hypothetical protein
MEAATLARSRGRLVVAHFYSANINVQEFLMRVAREDRYLGDCHMSEKMISRRGTFSLLGLAAALAFGVPAEVLTASDAEAQAQTPPPAPSGAPSGTERRQKRRTGRTERRQERRTTRTERRQKRRTSRTERRKKRRGGGEAAPKQ